MVDSFEKETTNTGLIDSEEKEEYTVFYNLGDVLKSSDKEEHTIESNITNLKLSLRIDDFNSEKDLERFVKSCERLVRNSPEYKLWVSYIRDVLNLTVCHITGESLNETTVDLHHHPFSLFMIVKGLIYKKIGNDEKFCSFDIAMETIEMHFNMYVPFVPLVYSLHEKFHNGFLKIPMEIVYGNCDYLMKEIFPFLDPDEQNVIIERLSINKSNCGWEKGYKWISMISNKEEMLVGL